MAKAVRTFRTQKRTIDDVKKRAALKGGGFDTLLKPEFKMDKMKDGKNLIRILPPTWEGAKHYGYDLWVNYGIGVDNQSYLSLSKMLGKKDPIAEGRRVLEQDGDDKAAKELAPRQRIGMWIIDRTDEDEGPQFFSCPFSLDKAIINLSFDEDTKEVQFIDDLKTGNDIRFYKEGQGLKTDYDPSKIRIMKPSPLTTDKAQLEEIKQFLADNPVPEALNFYDYKHIAQVFNGASGDDDDEDEAPKKRKRAAVADDDDEDDTPAPKKRRAVVADDDDDEDDAPPAKRKRATIADDDDEDEDEDETPAPKRKAKPPVDDEDADDEDEPAPKARRRAVVDDDADDEDETPAPKTKKRAAVADDDDEDEDEPAPKAKGKKAAPADDDDDDEDEGAAIKARLARRRAASGTGKGKKAAVDDDEEDD